MRVGVPKEIKVMESRVGLTPESVATLTAAGHEVLVETTAGSGSGFDDSLYTDAGATIVPTAADVFAGAQLIVKVKEPQLEECARLQPHHVLFTYLHLAAVPEITQALIESGATAIAYETVTDEHGGLPLLKPMSAVAGRLAVQAGATALQKSQGGSGILMGGAQGMPAARVLVLGAGIAGGNAAEVALGMQAHVTVVDRTAANLERLKDRLGDRLNTAMPDTIPELVSDADLVIGAVLIAGARAPKLVTRQMLKTMRPGSVVADISVDQGGCFETSKPTTLAEPTYVVDGIVHYCVTNMPGDVPRTSTYALNHATLPCVQAIARHGWKLACEKDSHLAAGINVQAGKLCIEF